MTHGVSGTPLSARPATAGLVGPPVAPELPQAATIRTTATNRNPRRVDPGITTLPRAPAGSGAIEDAAALGPVRLSTICATAGRAKCRTARVAHTVDA